MCHITLKTCYGYDLIVCICRNVLPVYLLIFQLYLLFFAATMFMVNKDYQLIGKSQWCCSANAAVHCTR